MTLSWWLHYCTFAPHFDNIIFEFSDDLMEAMIAAADREELNYLFSDSLSDADLLRAIECIELAQMSVDRAPQIDATSNVIHNTSRAESTGNAGSVEKAAQLQFGMFCTLII